MESINSLQFVTGMGNSPAAISLKSGICYINEDRISDFSANVWEFIIEHENAHLLFKTSNEFFVDRIAFNRQLRKGRSMKEIYRQCHGFLWQEGEQKERLRALLNHGKWISNKLSKLTYDYTIQANRIKAMDELIDQLTENFKQALDEGNGSKALDIAKDIKALATSKEELDEITDVIEHLNEKMKAQTKGAGFLGMGKKGKVATTTNTPSTPSTPKVKKPSAISTFLQKSQERKDEKIAIRKTKVEANAEAKLKRAEAKLTLANQGIDTSAGNVVKNIYGKVIDVAGKVAGPILSAQTGGLLGANMQETIAPDDMPPVAEAGQKENQADDKADKKPSTWLIVGGIIAGVVVIGGVIYAIYHFTKAKVTQ